MDEISCQGFELEGRYSPLSGLSIEGSYSFVEDTGSTSAGYMVEKDIKNIPQSVSRLGFTCSPLRTLDIVCWGRRYDGVRTSDNVTGETTIEEWMTVDLSVNYALAGHLKLQALLTNLTDEEYLVGGTVTRPLPRPGLGARLGASYTF